jgi:hypothetical protein
VPIRTNRKRCTQHRRDMQAQVLQTFSLASAFGGRRSCRAARKLPAETDPSRPSGAANIVTQREGALDIAEANCSPRSEHGTF